MRGFRRVASGAALLATAVLAAMAASVTGARGETVIVGTSGDYAPFSFRPREDTGSFRGFDIALAEAWSRERGFDLRFEPFAWPELLDRLAEGDFDVAMSGITLRPERTAAGRFSVPVAETGAVLLVPRSRSWNEVHDANAAGVRIGVNAGGHLERVANEHFDSVVLVAIPDNRAVLRALLAGQVDAAVTDSLEAVGWLAEAQAFRALGPFTRDRKAYLFAAERADLAADLDRWLLEREADGTLSALREEHFGSADAGGGRTAEPMRALLAGVDERLSLMPMVGAAKRRQGFPLEVPEREALVLRAASADVRAAASHRGVEPPPDASVLAFFRAQMEAAKQVQWSSVKAEDIGPDDPLPDFEGALRPAILRIGAHIVELVLALPEDLDAETVRRVAREELRTEHLERDRLDAIADAITALSRARTTPASKPPAQPPQAPAPSPALP